MTNREFFNSLAYNPHDSVELKLHYLGIEQDDYIWGNGWLGIFEDKKIGLKCYPSTNVAKDFERQMVFI